MAYETNLLDEPCEASSNVATVTYSGNPPVYASGGIPQFYAVVDDTGTANESDVKVAGANAAIRGIAQDGPAVGPGGAVRVRSLGISKMVAGAAIAYGALIQTDSSGRGVTAAAGTATNLPVIGVARSAATQAGDLFSIFLMPGAASLVTA